MARILTQCRAYAVEVIPNYQSLRGKTLRTEIVVPPKVTTDPHSSYVWKWKRLQIPVIMNAGKRRIEQHVIGNERCGPPFEFVSVQLGRKFWMRSAVNVLQLENISSKQSSK